MTNARQLSALLLASLLSAACTPDNAIDRRTHTDTFTQEPSAEVDILWVVDNSNSMESEQQLVADGFESFIRTIEETNIDFHVGVITTNMDADNPDRGKLLGEPQVITPEDDYVMLFEDRIRVGTDGSDKEKGLAAALGALSEPHISSINEGFRRDDAALSIIFVSDEDDCSDNESLAAYDGSACYSREELLVPVRDYVDEYKDLAATGNPLVLTSGIVGPDVDEDCDETWPGHRYEAVADAMGGVVGSICNPDYSNIMDRMGLAVSGVLTVFQLTYVPVDGSIEVGVDETIVDEDAGSGWTYDDTYYTIRFDGDFVPQRDSTISITYEVAGNIP